MAERNEHKSARYQDGDIYLNPCFGDLWVVDGASFIKINNGYAIELDEPEGFIKVGHIDGVNPEESVIPKFFEITDLWKEVKQGFISRICPA